MLAQRRCQNAAVRTMLRRCRISRMRRGWMLRTGAECPADAPFQHDSFDGLMQCKIGLGCLQPRCCPCGALEYACWQDEMCRTLTHRLKELDPEGLCSPEVLNGVAGLTPRHADKWRVYI